MTDEQPKTLKLLPMSTDVTQLDFDKLTEAEKWMLIRELPDALANPVHHAELIVTRKPEKRRKRCKRRRRRT